MHSPSSVARAARRKSRLRGVNVLGGGVESGGEIASAGAHHWVLLTAEPPQSLPPHAGRQHSLAGRRRMSGSGWQMLPIHSHDLLPIPASLSSSPPLSSFSSCLSLSRSTTFLVFFSLSPPHLLATICKSRTKTRIKLARGINVCHKPFVVLDDSGCLNVQ